MKALLKAVNAGPGIVASTLIVSLIIGPALPDWAGIALFYCGLAVVGFLGAGVGESLAVRVLFSARALNENERIGMAPVIVALCHLELGPPVVELFVSRRHGSPAAIAHGRRSIVLAPELVHAILTRQLPHREAVAVIAHASLVARSGLSRQDLAIHFWSTPWRILVAIGRPLHGVFGFAWKIRVIVFGIAIWQSFGAGLSSHGLDGSVVAAMLFILLALTYLMPRWAAGWQTHVEKSADRELVARGLGSPMAAFLRRYPQTTATIGRVQLLDQTREQEPGLRLVGA